MLATPELIRSFPKWALKAVDLTRENASQFEQFIPGDFGIEQAEDGANQVCYELMLTLNQVSEDVLKYLNKIDPNSERGNKLLKIIQGCGALSEVMLRLSEGKIHLFQSKDANRARYQSAYLDSAESFQVRYPEIGGIEFSDLIIMVRSKRAVQAKSDNYASFRDFELNEHRAEPRFVLAVKIADGPEIVVRVDMDKERVPDRLPLQGRGITFDLIFGGEKIDWLQNEFADIPIEGRRYGHHFDCEQIKGGMDKKYYFSDLLQALLSRVHALTIQ